MELILAVACDDARVRPDGKLDIEGVFNELYAPGFPAKQDRMTVVFIIEWGRDESGRIPLRADLVDEDGQKSFTIQGHTDVEPRPADRAPAQKIGRASCRERVYSAGGDGSLHKRV